MSLIDPFEEMLRLIAYDIADSRRLRQVAEACEDYGVRVQKSLFECWLEEARFRQLWARLQRIVDAEQDSIAVNVLDAASARRRQTLGKSQILTQPRTRFIL